MTQTAKTLIQQVFTWPTSYDLTVSDDQGTGRTVTVGTLNTATYWRLWLASSASPGTPSTDATAPKSLFAHLENQLNAGGSAIWSVALTTGGLPQFTYSGSTTPGTIVFPSDMVRHPLGYVANVACATGGGTSTASYLPTFSVQFLNRRDTDGWTRMPGFIAAAKRPNGSVYGWTDRRTGRRAKFTTEFLPSDWAKRTTNAAAATPMWPDDTDRYLEPYSDADAAPPWSVHDFLNTCLGQQCGMLWGTMQDAIAGSVTTYDVVTIDPTTLQNENGQRIQVANWDAYAKLVDINLNWMRTESL